MTNEWKLWMHHVRVNEHGLFACPLSFISDCSFVDLWIHNWFHIPLLLTFELEINSLIGLTFLPPPSSRVPSLILKTPIHTHEYLSNSFAQMSTTTCILHERLCPSSWPGKWKRFCCSRMPRLWNYSSGLLHPRVTPTLQKPQALEGISHWRISRKMKSIPFKDCFL